MKEHPIIFSTEMVRAIIDGRKTQTRRIVKALKLHPDYGEPIWDEAFVDGKPPEPYLHIPFNGLDHSGRSVYDHCGRTVHRHYPNCEVGDRLWVRENIRTLVCQRNNKTWEYGEFEIEYIADKTIIRCPDEHEEWWRHNWHKRPATTIPSIRMPKWAARIFLEITNIRVERVQDISRNDAMAEGCREKNDEHGWYSPEVQFVKLWDSINDKRSYGWDKNPWVWVIEFKKL